MIHKLLLNPKHTLALTCTGLASIGAMLAAQVVALTPLTQIPLRDSIKAHILAIVGGLSAASTVCLVGAACGRSFIQFIDNNGLKPQPDPGLPAQPPAELPKAA